MSGQSKQQKKSPVPQWDNPLEAIKSLSLDVGKSVKNDLITDGWGDVLEQFGLRPSRKISGTLAPSETLNLAQFEKTESQELKRATLFKEEKRSEILLVTQESQEIAQKITQIQWELKKLVASTKELNVEFKEITVESAPAKPGIYHLNFFEWLLSLIKSLREKVDDSRVWLQAFQSKKAKRGYWAMFQKHGTSFGLSGERVVATQTG